MKEEIIKLVGDSLSSLNMKIDDVIYRKENGNNNLEIVLDSDDVIDIDKIVEATKIIDPIIEKSDIIKEKYILDIYGKSKGDE